MNFKTTEEREKEDTPKPDTVEVEQIMEQLMALTHPSAEIIPDGERITNFCILINQLNSTLISEHAKNIKRQLIEEIYNSVFSETVRQKVATIALSHNINID